MRLKGAADDEFVSADRGDDCRRLEQRRGPGACCHRRRARVDALPRILFRTIGRGTGKLTRTVLPGKRVCDNLTGSPQGQDRTKLGNQSFRVTGITAYL